MKGIATLDNRKQSLLNRVPDPGNYASFALHTVNCEYLAYLSAKTGDEFALLRGKTEDLLYHGTPDACPIYDSEPLMFLLKSGKLRLEANSHIDLGDPTMYSRDVSLLREIGQREGRIVSSCTGEIFEFLDE